MNNKDLKRLIRVNEQDICFVVGNGINRHFNNKSASWTDLLTKMWQRHSPYTQSTVPEGISYPEFFDALDLQQSDAVLQKYVKKEMSKWQASNSQNVFLKGIESLGAPILTTNQDALMANTMKLTLRKIGDGRITDFYPWSSFYGAKDMNTPMGGFAVWHINGMVHYSRSIKLGLSHYMGNVQRARTMILKKKGQKRLLNQPEWTGFKTWLNIFFHKALFIVGLGLEENEVFLRWLLIQRAKYYRLHPELRKPSWYVSQDGENRQTQDGKRLFLQWAGFQWIGISDYRQVYEDVWVD